MTCIPDDLRQLVIKRAQSRCEYCGLSQHGQAATFHIDHIVPVCCPSEKQSACLTATPTSNRNNRADSILAFPQLGRTVVPVNEVGAAFQ